MKMGCDAVRRWALAAVVAAGMGWAVAAEPRSVQLDGVAAYVDDEVITLGDVRETMDPLVAKLRQAYSGAELDAQLRKAYDQSLNDLIERRLILKAYAKLGQTLPDRVVERRVNEMITERFNNDRAALLDALHREQISYEEWRNQVRDHIIIASMRKMILDQKVVISPAAIREVYETRSDRYRIPGQIRLSLIRIGVGEAEADRPARRALAESIARQAATNADFAALARQVSEDGQAAQGGDWGWMTPEELRPELAEAVRALPAGSVSPLLTIDRDYYLVKVGERREAAQVPFSEAQVEIERELRRQESMRQYEAWIARQKREFNVRVVKAPDA